MCFGLVWLTSNQMSDLGDFWDKSPSFYSGNFNIFKNALRQFIAFPNMWLLVLIKFYTPWNNQKTLGELKLIDSL